MSKRVATRGAHNERSDIVRLRNMNAIRYRHGCEEIAFDKKLEAYDRECEKIGRERQADRENRHAHEHAMRLAREARREAWQREYREAARRRNAVTDFWLYALNNPNSEVVSGLRERWAGDRKVIDFTTERRNRL